MSRRGTARRHSRDISGKVVARETTNHAAEKGWTAEKEQTTLLRGRRACVRRVMRTRRGCVRDEASIFAAPDFSPRPVLTLGERRKIAEKWQLPSVSARGIAIIVCGRGRNPVDTRA